MLQAGVGLGNYTTRTAEYKIVQREIKQVLSNLWVLCLTVKKFLYKLLPRGVGWGGGVLPESLGRGVQPASQNTYPIYDQNLQYTLLYLCRPDQKFETLFITCFTRAL